MLILNKNSGLTIDQIDQVEPVKYVEKYQPNKEAVIFREKIFTNNDNNVSFAVKLVEGE